jgi:hypothetical protein
MINARFLGGALLLASLSGSPALAGPYADDLSKCLVSSTTDKDQTDLVRWLFAAAALHPDVSSIAAVSDQQRSEMGRTVGQLFERLLTESCRAQFRDAMKYEGSQTIEVSFSVLGEVAMRNLIQDPAVSKAIGELETFVNQEKLQAVMRPDEP